METEAIYKLREALCYGTGPATWRDLVEDALDLLEAERTLRPLRWYTDARDGLCPEAE